MTLDQAAEHYFYNREQIMDVERGHIKKAFIAGNAHALASPEVLALVKCVDEQAKDEGLWSVPLTGLQPIAEAYLQQELRKLHALVESAFREAQGGG